MIKLSNKSWHYKLYNLFNRTPPINTCEYFLAHLEIFALFIVVVMASIITGVGSVLRNDDTKITLEKFLMVLNDSPLSVLFFGFFQFSALLILFCVLLFILLLICIGIDFVIKQFLKTKLVQNCKQKFCLSIKVKE